MALRTNVGRRRVDEVQLFVYPLVLGGQKAALGATRRADLELVGERRFGNGVVLLRYLVR